MTSWPLVGREEQLKRIASAMGHTRTRGVVVVGASGLGKTRLATEALQRAARHGASTVWAVATRAAASIPFGPLAHLLPDVAGDADSRLDLLRSAGRALEGRARGRRVVLGIDDAHLLDDASAALVHHLASTGTAFVVATLRAGETAPDAVSALWKDGHAEWLELQPLSEAEVTRLVESGVGGPVEAGTIQRLRQLSLGNALFLRELVSGAVESGALVDDGGLWRATGALPTSSRLVELVQARLGRLEPEVRAVAEVVAVGEPLGAALLEAVVPPADVEAADRAGLLQVLPDPRRTIVRLAHPLYGELLRATTTSLRARTIPRRLAAALHEGGARRRDDLLRLAVWQLEGGAAPDPTVLVPAARRALWVFDPRLADRLATAAIAGGGGFPARLTKAAVENALGHAEQAESELAELERQVPAGDDAARLALLRADNLLNGLGRTGEAEQVLDRADDVVTSPRWRDELAVLRAGLAMLQGRIEQAATSAEPVLARPDARPSVILRALAADVAASAYRGQLGDAIAGAARATTVAGGAEAEVSLPYDRVIIVLALAYRMAGELDEADRVALPRHAAALRRGAGDVRDAWSIVVGEVSMARGRMPEAVRLLQETSVGLREHLRSFGSHGLSWCLGSLAQAAAVSGRPALADQALREAEGVTPAAHYVPSLDLGRAWTLACAGDVQRGREAASEAALRSRALGAAAFEAIALHDAARLGGATGGAGRLAELAGQVEGRLGQAYAAAAAALAARDAGALEAVSATFEQIGALLLAAESAAAAARQHAAAGRGTSSRAAAAHTRALIRRCGDLRTPGLALPDDPDLTPRERQVAERAARGLSSRAIAEELSLSTRTVDNHLRSAYAKLGVAGRDELTGVL